LTISSDLPANGELMTFAPEMADDHPKRIAVVGAHQ
jgi:hypothetical protein